MGAYLTQNTAWTNVERALAGLRSARLLSLEGIRRAPLATLERLIRPSGYFRRKRSAFIAVEHRIGFRRRTPARAGLKAICSKTTLGST